MSTPYSNLPAIPPPNLNSSDGTVRAFNSYFSAPVELDAGTLNAMTGFFESRGFDVLTSKSIAVVIMVQARNDGYNPMVVLDSLTGLDGLAISQLATQILNFNRFKSSFLGYSSSLEPYQEIQRNILADQALPKSYVVVPSASSVNEGETIKFRINTSNVKNGEVLYWNLLGSTVNAADLSSGVTSGTVTINNGFAVVTIGIAQDQLIETTETIQFNLRTGSQVGPVVADAVASVVNTTIEFIADYIVIEYIFNTGRDLDTRTRLVDPLIGPYVGWGQADVADILLEWGGDNVSSTGSETALFRVDRFKTYHPTNTRIKIDCRAQWYGVVGTTAVGLKITLYSGGTMMREGYNWVNPTATGSLELATDITPVYLRSRNAASIGQRIAVLNYNVVTGQGFLDTTDTTTY